MSLRKQFFEEPMLRATPFYNLNDPFEGRYSEEQVRNVNKYENEYLNPEGVDINPDENEHHIQAVMEGLQDDLFEYGVVSFTEDYSNLLMWSHYADEHKGFVLEIENRPWLTDSYISRDDDEFRYKKNPLSNIEEKPVRVVYKDSQPKFELQHDALPDDRNINYQKLIKSIFLTKGDRWLYEKEHRSLLKVSYADRIITKYDPYIENICRGEIEIKQLDDGYCELNFKYDHDVDDNEDVNGEGIRVGIEVVSKSSTDTIHLYRIDPKFITGIYFGCHVSDSDINEIMKTVHENKRFLKNLKFKKAKVSDRRYELIFQEIEYNK